MNAHKRELYTGIEWFEDGRGKRIVLGMPKGFYPGYDREISEVYVFRMFVRRSRP
jgi:hypothetical protein